MTMHRVPALLVGGVFAATLMGTAGPAGAVAYGEPDGARHPYVGVLVVDWLDAGDLLGSDGVPEPYCSTTLISSRVALTAGHCFAILEGIAPGRSQHVAVTFAEQWTPQTPVLTGTMVMSPFAGSGNQAADDLSAVILDRPVDTTPANLPSAGLLDAWAASSTLHGRLLQTVGYGSREPVLGPGGPQFEFPRLPGIRQMAVGAITALNPRHVVVDQNPVHGFGGGCLGDSGGGLLDGRLLVGVATSGDAMCQASGTNARLDTPNARTFLAEIFARAANG